MRKPPMTIRFKSYLNLIRSAGLFRLIVSILIMQFLGGWGAIFFSFIGTFIALGALEKKLNIRLL